jgi:hypothetical protein
VISYSWVSYDGGSTDGGSTSSDGGSTLKQNTVIRVSRLFVLCISLVFGGKYMEFHIIFSLQYSISINTFEVDPPPPSDSSETQEIKYITIFAALYYCHNSILYK